MGVLVIKKKRISTLPDSLLSSPTQPVSNDYFEKYKDELRTVKGNEIKVDGDLLAGLVEEGNKLHDDKFALDAWLAPRIHSALRIPRRVASVPEFWSWISLSWCRPYVIARFANAEGHVPRWRYTGTFQRNAVSRLWWGAEMGRNGPDYAEVATIFARTRTAQFALELKYSWYRAAAIAFARVAEGKDGGKRLNDDQMSALSRTANAYLSLTSLEAIAVQEGAAPELDVNWWESAATLPDLIERAIGPEDGYVDSDTLGTLTKWFRNHANAVLADEKKED